MRYRYVLFTIFVLSNVGYSENLSSYKGQQIQFDTNESIDSAELLEATDNEKQNSVYAFPRIETLKPRFEKIKEELKLRAFSINRGEVAYLDDVIFKELIVLDNVFNPWHPSSEGGDVATWHANIRYLAVRSIIKKWEKWIELCKKAEEMSKNHKNKTNDDIFYPDVDLLDQLDP